MGESERYIDRRVKKITLGEDNNALIALISINAIGLIIPGLIKIIYKIVDPASSCFLHSYFALVYIAGKTCRSSQESVDDSKLYVRTYTNYYCIHKHALVVGFRFNFTGYVWQ